MKLPNEIRYTLAFIAAMFQFVLAASTKSTDMFDVYAPICTIGIIVILTMFPVEKRS